MSKKTIVLGASSGIGKAISDSLKSIGCNVVSASSKDVDTSDLDSVRAFAHLHKNTDILVLNTGGPPAKEFFDVEENEWTKYHNQLFLGFCTLLKEITVNNKGYIFLITSGVVKEPSSRLVISSSYRAAFSSVFKILSKSFYAQKNVSCINIMPGPIKTDRLYELISDMDEFEKSLPMKRTGNPSEIGEFVKSVVENDIKYLSGVTINFDGAGSNYVF